MPALGIAVLILLVLWQLASSRTSRGNRARGRKARQAENEAERLLEQQGYRIVDRQVTMDWPMEVDGQAVDARLRLDLLVERKGKHYAAEVKSGSVARVTHPDTRRQLLEYLLACEVDGVLLVDMEQHAIREVDFPLLWKRHID